MWRAFSHDTVVSRQESGVRIQPSYLTSAKLNSVLSEDCWAYCIDFNSDDLRGSYDNSTIGL